MHTNQPYEVRSYWKHFPLWIYLICMFFPIKLYEQGRRLTFSYVTDGLPQLSWHSMLRDGQRCLGSHKVVAGVMAMSAHLTQDAGRAHTENKKTKKENSNTQRTKINNKGISTWFNDPNSSLPALVSSFRGEFVAAAAVGGVAEWFVWGGGTWPGAYWTVAQPAGLEVLVGWLVGATLTGKVAAHPLHHLFDHLIFELSRVAWCQQVKGEDVFWDLKK